MKRLGLLLPLGFLVACGMHSAARRSLTVADLRQAAAKHPENAALASELALAELFGRGGDAALVQPELARARKLDPKALRVVLADALLQDVHGHPAQALELYLATIQLAVTSRDPEAAHILEAAVYAVGGSDGSVVGYLNKVRQELLPLLLRADLAGPVRAAVGDVLMPLAYRRGDLGGVSQLAAALGCSTEFRVAGPFGPRDLLGFDDPPLASPGEPLAESYDLGSGRGVRATRTAHARGCAVHLGAGPVAEAGTSWAQTRVQAKAAGEYLVRVDTPNSVEVFVDGHSVQRIDRRSKLGARVVFFKLALSAGSHLFALKLSARHPNPVLELAVLPLTSADERASALPGDERAQDGFPLYLRAGISLLRGDVIFARQALSVVDADKQASPMLLLQRASVALGDPLLPDDVRGDEGRLFLSRARQRDAQLWAPAMHLATLAAKSGRTKEAIAALRDATQRWPEPPVIGFALIELLRSKDRNAEADREVARLRELVPDACGPLAAELAALRARQRASDVATLAQKLVACDAQSTAQYSLYLARRDFAAAQKEEERLASFEPEEEHYGRWLADLSLAKESGDEAAVLSLIGKLRAGYPRAYTPALEEIDMLFAKGQKAQALVAAERALSTEPASMAGLYRYQPLLGGKHVLGDYRKDGAQAIAAFQAQARKYDAPQVLVLDYMAVRVFEDGSSLELVHTIQQAQSDEAVNQLAEVDVPEGAQVLTLRAWKPDGRKLEADTIAGKQSISLPNVARGDYVELEYLQANAPADGFPHGYLGERFYFKSFEVPFHHSQMVVILPKSMPYAVDPRGPAPKVEEQLKGEARVLTFQVDESLPLTAEPAAVSPREFIPSVRVGVNASWQAMVDSLRDVLVDRDLYDPYYAALVKEIVGEAAPTDHRLRAERLYAWVLRNIENNNDIFSQAALLLRAKSGNRGRVLHYLLGLAGVPSQLALARSLASDSTESSMADADTYDHLLLRIDLATGPIWLFTVERWAPFGFIPAVLRGQPALAISAGAPRLRVSEGLLGDDSRKFLLQVNLHADGSAHLDATELVHGTDAVSWRQQLEEIPVAELKRRFAQDYVTRLFPGATLTSLEITGREQDRPDLTLSYSLDIASFGRRVGDAIALPPLLASELASSFARTASRQTTELVPGSVHNQLIMHIKLPASASRPPLAAPIALRAAFGARPSFTENTSLDGDGIVLARQLDLPAQRIQPKDYQVWSEFCRRVDQAEGRELIIPIH